MLRAFLPLPESLHARSLLAKQELTEALARAGYPLVELSPSILNDACRVAALSDFALDYLKTNPQALLDPLFIERLARPLQAGELLYLLEEVLQGCVAEEDLIKRLRLFRNTQQLRIIWRDLLHRAPITSTCAELSDMADICLNTAVRWLFAAQVQQYGQPVSALTGHPQEFIVLAMGKLGAQELNLSSDIDLIFAYPEAGETVGGLKVLDNQEFFIRLGQRLIKVLDKPTQDGFVFRVDMRLRPYGSAGPLVYSFAALEEYYQNQGRDWERYAMIKARVVVGSTQEAERLLKLLKPFVYRRYLDFSAIEALRAMKRLIEQEVRRKGMDENIKLGSGGIREVEFIAQVFQLIHGGRNPALQQRPLQIILDTLGEQGYVPTQTVTQLQQGYLFLRYTEHALQAIADQQTQKLPSDPLNRARVAAIFGCPDWDSFMQQLNQWRACVKVHFQEIIATPNEASVGALEEQGREWLPLWNDLLEESAAIKQLHQAGFQVPEAALKCLLDLKKSPQLHSLQRIGRERLDVFMPLLLRQLQQQTYADSALQRVMPLLEAVLRRSAYLVLLAENAGALQRLVQLCAASSWIAQEMVRYPALLDELLNEQRLFHLPLAPELAAQLREQLARIPEDDLEQQMEALRHFKRAHRLRVAASEATGALPLMKVSDYLTWLAETILQSVLSLSWQQMVQRYGRPKRQDGAACTLDFVVIGYGKVGGIELGHDSDLDLVFVHDADPHSETDGLKTLDGAQFFTRLGQRIVHVLGAQTPSGKLYEVDMRLRPSGEAGLLVCSLAAFVRYQQQDAWTWEHQALVRARVLVGCPRVAAAFTEIRAQALARARDLDVLRQEVSAMRAKMRASHGTLGTQAGTSLQAFRADHWFDLKQDAGGIVDIEFMVQYAVLAWSHEQPLLLRYTDNMRILDDLGALGFLPQSAVVALQEAYKELRAAAHRQALQSAPARIAGDLLVAQRQQVQQIWQQLGLT